MTSTEQQYIANNSLYQNRVLALLIRLIQEKRRDKGAAPVRPTIKDESSLTDDEVNRLAEFDEASAIYEKKENMISFFVNNRARPIYGEVITEVQKTGVEVVKNKDVIDIDKTISDAVLEAAIAEVWRLREQ